MTLCSFRKGTLLSQFFSTKFRSCVVFYPAVKNIDQIKTKPRIFGTYRLKNQWAISRNTPAKLKKSELRTENAQRDLIFPSENPRLENSWKRNSWYNSGRFLCGAKSWIIDGSIFNTESKQRVYIVNCLKTWDEVKQFKASQTIFRKH